VRDRVILALLVFLAAASFVALLLLGGISPLDRLQPLMLVLALGALWWFARAAERQRARLKDRRHR
jgi:hypothetical protein